MAKLIAGLSLLWLSAAAVVSAQDDAPEEELTRPPRISGDVSPGDAQLEPPTEDREDMLEAVVTGGQTDFRLPDLGTSLRRDDDRRDPNQRFDTTFLYLYDPENMDPAEEAFPSLDEQMGVGMLRIFEVRFRSRERN